MLESPQQQVPSQNLCRLVWTWLDLLLFQLLGLEVAQASFDPSTVRNSVQIGAWLGICTSAWSCQRRNVFHEILKHLSISRDGTWSNYPLIWNLVRRGGLCMPHASSFEHGKCNVTQLCKAQGEPQCVLWSEAFAFHRLCVPRRAVSPSRRKLSAIRKLMVSLKSRLIMPWIQQSSYTHAPFFVQLIVSFIDVIQTTDHGLVFAFVDHI